jgi:hypothetical protein
MVAAEQTEHTSNVFITADGCISLTPHCQVIFLSISTVIDDQAPKTAGNSTNPN